MHKRLVYVSQGAGAFGLRDISRLLSVARANNARHDITGLLVANAGMFFQVLEGPAAGVAATFARIGADARHTDVTVLLDEATPERAFRHWKMGYATPDALTPALRSDVVSLTRLAAFNSPVRGRDAGIRRIVRHFLDSAREIDTDLGAAARPGPAVFSRAPAAPQL